MAYDAALRGAASQLDVVPVRHGIGAHRERVRNAHGLEALSTRHAERAEAREWRSASSALHRPVTGGVLDGEHVVDRPAPGASADVELRVPDEAQVVRQAPPACGVVERLAEGLRGHARDGEAQPGPGEGAAGLHVRARVVVAGAEQDDRLVFDGWGGGTQLQAAAGAAGEVAQRHVAHPVGRPGLGRDNALPPGEVGGGPAGQLGDVRRVVGKAVLRVPQGGADDDAVDGHVDLTELDVAGGEAGAELVEELIGGLLVVLVAVEAIHVAAQLLEFRPPCPPRNPDLIVELREDIHERWTAHAQVRTAEMAGASRSPASRRDRADSAPLEIRYHSFRQTAWTVSVNTRVRTKRSCESTGLGKPSQHVLDRLRLLPLYCIHREGRTQRELDVGYVDAHSSRQVVSERTP
jgi:hypothetical protein